MIRSSKYILLFIVFLIAEIDSIGAKGTVLIPEPILSLREIVHIQLSALKNEDKKNIQLGLFQAWQFAHPSNKSVIVPFQRFSKMITETAYSSLINHLSHNITFLNERRHQVIYEVEIISESGRLFSVDWVISVVKWGKFKDCWMTSNVSLPLLKGTAI